MVSGTLNVKIDRFLRFSSEAWRAAKISEESGAPGPARLYREYAALWLQKACDLARVA